MLISKKNRIIVYSYLFKEGTIVVKKDVEADKHSDQLLIRNLEVMKLLQSFSSRGFVTETFNWQYYYYTLTDEGIKYLREYLGLPEDIVPATLKKTVNVTAKPSYRKTGEDDKRKSFGGERRGDRDSYRKKEVV
eukprot:gene17306-22843_t